MTRRNLSSVFCCKEGTRDEHTFSIAISKKGRSNDMEAAEAGSDMETNGK
jgi:hypothetical protein